MRSMRMLASQLHDSLEVNRDAFPILLQTMMLFIFPGQKILASYVSTELCANSHFFFVIVNLTTSFLLASFPAMTSKGENTQPSIEMNAPTGRKFWATEPNKGPTKSRTEHTVCGCKIKCQLWQLDHSFSLIM